MQRTQVETDFDVCLYVEKYRISIEYATIIK